MTTPDLEGRVTAGMRAAMEVKEMLCREVTPSVSPVLPPSSG
jgi:hypothetical protein